MARLPQVGGDDGSWGEILNDFLSQSLASDGSIKPGAIDKSTVGLGNVDNTSDANKPISIATQVALDDKVSADDLGTAASADASDFASAAQGALADSAVQPAELDSAATAAAQDVVDTHTANTTNVHGITDTSLLLTTSAGASPADGNLLVWSASDNAYVPVSQTKVILLETSDLEPPADTPAGTIVYRKV